MRRVQSQQRQELQQQQQQPQQRQGQQPQQREDEELVCCCMAEECYGWSWSVGILLAALLVSILVPISFHYIGYDEQCFAKNKFGTVDTNTLYTYQAKFLPLNYDVVCFPTFYQVVDYTKANGDSLNVATADGFSFNIDVQFHYILRPEQLKLIYRNYTFGYDALITNHARTAIKGVSVQFQTDDYVFNRKHICDVMYRAVVRQISTIMIVEIPRDHFLLLDVYLPQSYLDQSILSAIQIQENQIQRYRQDINRIVYETQLLVSTIDAKASVTFSNAVSNSTTIISNARAEAQNIVSTARTQGQRYAIDVLNITVSANIDKFLQYSAILQTSGNPKVVYGAPNVTPIVQLA